MPWGAVIGAVGSIAGGALAGNAASKNAEAAQQTAQMEINATSPYDINANGSMIGYAPGAAGAPGSVISTLNPTLQGLQSGFYGGAGNFLNNIGALSQTGGINPFLANAYSQYQSSVPQTTFGNVNGNVPSAFFGNQQQLQGLTNTGQNLAAQYQNQAFNPNQINDYGLGSQFSGSASGLLGQLGGFNPQQSGQNYANLLAQQSAPGNALAANNLAQQLFNTGNLGSTGGANQMEALQQSQGATYAAQQAAGQQLGLQQQGLLGSLASQFGNIGSGITNQTALTNSGLQTNALNQYGSALGQALGANQFGTSALFNQANTAFSNQMNLANMGFNQQNTLANQNYQNALGLMGAGSANIGSNLSAAQGLFGGGQAIDQYLAQLLTTGSNIGAARTGAVTNAGNTALQGLLAQNNTNAANWSGIIGSLGQVGKQYMGSPSNGGYGGYAGTMNTIQNDSSANDAYSSMLFGS